MLVYSFPSGSKAVYDFKIGMEGYIPLLGKTDNRVEVQAVIEVRGAGAGTDGNLGVTSEFLEFQASLGGVPLPFRVNDVKTYFPKTTLSVTPHGKVVKSDAPLLEMPIRLPGLDSRRIPDVTFLPIEFPVEGVEVGKTWSFKRKFGDPDIEYAATTSSITDDLVKFEVKIVQKLSFLEDSGGYETKDEKAAATRVETTLAGSGKVEFDRKRGLSKLFTAETEAVSQVTEIKSGKTSERKVRSRLKVELRP